MLIFNIKTQGTSFLYEKLIPQVVPRAQRECAAYSSRADTSFLFKRCNCKSFQKMLNN